MKTAYTPNYPFSEISFWQMTLRFIALAGMYMAFIIFFLITIKGIFGIIR